MLLDSLSFICIVVVRQPFDPFHPCRSAAFPSFVSLSLGSLLTRFVLVPGPSAAFRFFYILLHVFFLLQLCDLSGHKVCKYSLPHQPCCGLSFIFQSCCGRYVL